MQVIKVTEDDTLRIEFSADEARQIRDDLGHARYDSASAKFARYVDTLYGEGQPRHHRPTVA